MNQNLITEDLKQILDRNLWQIGYTNIHGLKGLDLLPRGPGALKPAKWNQSVRFVGTGYVVIESACTWPNGPRAAAVFVHTELVALATEAELVAWLEANGTRSEGGQ